MRSFQDRYPGVTVRAAEDAEDVVKWAMNVAERMLIDGETGFTIGEQVALAQVLVNAYTAERISG